MFQVIRILRSAYGGNAISRQVQNTRETLLFIHPQFLLSPRQSNKGFCNSDKLLKMPVLGDVTNAVEGPTTPSKRARLESEGNVTLKFAKLSEYATEPKRTTKQAAGFDLCSAYDYKIPPGGKICAKTDLQIALPDGCYGRVAPRSGLAVKHFIDVGAGVIDQDYRGNVGVVLFNFGTEEFTVSKGDRIAQLILERIFVPDLQELSSLDDTERGAGGFGSTGTN